MCQNVELCWWVSREIQYASQSGDIPSRT